MSVPTRSCGHPSTSKYPVSLHRLHPFSLQTGQAICNSCPAFAMSQHFAGLHAEQINPPLMQAATLIFFYPRSLVALLPSRIEVNFALQTD